MGGWWGVRVPVPSLSALSLSVTLAVFVVVLGLQLRITTQGPIRCIFPVGVSMTNAQKRHSSVDPSISCLQSYAQPLTRCDIVTAYYPMTDIP